MTTISFTQEEIRHLKTILAMGQVPKGIKQIDRMNNTIYAKLETAYYGKR